MGREAKVVKERLCQHCKGIIYGTALQVAVHGNLCRRAEEVGLVLPGPLYRQPELIRP